MNRWSVESTLVTSLGQRLPFGDSWHLSKFLGNNYHKTRTILKPSQADHVVLDGTILSKVSASMYA